MKFYRDKKAIYYSDRIKFNNLTAIYTQYSFVIFYKNGKIHNTKNTAFIRYDGVKQFHLNDKYCGCQYDFTKKSWRRFVKLQAFL
jgi:hypothetical protein